MNNLVLDTDPPPALLLTAEGCAVCPAVHKILSQLETENKISHLEVINLTRQPAVAQQYGVRSVPWFRIGELEFQGMHDATELRYWAEHAQSDAGIRKYIGEKLEAGQLQAVENLLRSHPHWLAVAVSLVADMEAPIQARIGIGAIFENMQNEQTLRNLIPELSKLTYHADSRVRGDACYYLGLSGSPDALPSLQNCLVDENDDVREIARDAIEMISG